MGTIFELLMYGIARLYVLVAAVIYCLVRYVLYWLIPLAMVYLLCIGYWRILPLLAGCCIIALWVFNWRFRRNKEEKGHQDHTISGLFTAILLYSWFIASILCLFGENFFIYFFWNLVASCLIMAVGAFFIGLLN